MTKATQWKARATSWLLGLASLGFWLAPAHADDDESPPAPRLPPCSERYPLAADLQPSGWLESGKDSVRKDFDSTRDWGTEDNALILNPLASGLPEPALRVFYPENSSSPSDADQDEIPRGGLGFYTKEVLLRDVDRACLHYQVRFEANFYFVKGGKLPGLYGGEAPSGGEDVTGENGYSMRLMWREDGKGELYAYLVDREGESIGRGSWYFPSGRWVTIEQELILNTPGESDGIVRVWIDGWPVLEQRGLVYRTTEEVGIDGLMFSTFFGGTGEEWRTPRDQHADFAAFRLFAYEP